MVPDTVSEIEKITTKRLALYSGRTHPELASEVAANLGVDLGEVKIVEFANGEIKPRYAESVRGSRVRTHSRTNASRHSSRCSSDCLTATWMPRRRSIASNTVAWPPEPSRPTIWYRCWSTSPGFTRRPRPCPAR